MGDDSIINNNSNTEVTTDNKNNNNGLSSILQDNSGGLSSMRILLLTWGIGVFLIWGFSTVMSVIHGNYTAPVIPDSVITILLGITGSKIVQRFGEK